MGVSKRFFLATYRAYKKSSEGLSRVFPYKILFFTSIFGLSTTTCYSLGAHAYAGLYEEVSEVEYLKAKNARAPIYAAFVLTGQSICTCPPTFTATIEVTKGLE